MKHFLLLIIIIILFTSNIDRTTAYDTKNPPKPVKAVCNRVDKAQRRTCLDVFNTGSVQNADMRFLAYYTRDFAENNATSAMQRINSELIPRLPDPYIQQVLWVCKDAFEKVREELLERVNPMITTGSDFQDAKAWVKYDIGLMYSCRAVCMGNNNNNNKFKCPLTKDIDDTQGVLRLLYVVLDLLTEGFM